MFFQKNNTEEKKDTHKQPKDPRETPDKDKPMQKPTPSDSYTKMSLLDYLAEANYEKNF